MKRDEIRIPKIENFGRFNRPAQNYVYYNVSILGGAHINSGPDEESGPDCFKDKTLD